MGREFVDLFDHWAEHYDDTVKGIDNEYHEVFENYNEILEEVTKHTKGNVIEFGVGTGNLTEKLLQAGHAVFGVEPSRAMRDKVRERFPGLVLSDGDFLDFPVFDRSIDTIVSTYAFHHLNDEEKLCAVHMYSEMLPVDGKIVFADTIFADKSAKTELLERVQNQGYEDLLQDLNTEFYTFHSVLKHIFEECGFEVFFTKMNRYVWLINAMKK